MPTFPNFPKEVLPSAEEGEEDEVEVDAIEPTTIQIATKEKDQIRPEGEEEKIEFVNIESDKE
ncbi:hypothetical protein J1N35_012016 [Gossypium stocksii]|uniref:Uncharacterized protein n=1 Tax=Gossypium stocksii TaxID=47602 RepID=A0A9D3W4K3_9ROSI|nr:hypothetical protein J1N35_012016 [Gossypium stocksii]